MNRIRSKILGDKSGTGPPPVDPEKQMLVAIWCLANQEAFRLTIIVIIYAIHYYQRRPVKL